MLWTISVLLIMLWLLGLVTGYGFGYFIHIPLFAAIIVMLIKIEVDCDDYVRPYEERTYSVKGVKSVKNDLIVK